MSVFLNFSNKEESLLTSEENKLENLKFTGNIYLKLNKMFLLQSAMKIILHLKPIVLTFQMPTSQQSFVLLRTRMTWLPVIKM